MLLFSVLKRYSWLLILEETVKFIVNLKFHSILHILDKIIAISIFYPNVIS